MSLLKVNGHIVSAVRLSNGRYVFSEARSKLRREAPKTHQNDPRLKTSLDRESELRVKLSKIRIAR